jgi:predicted DNA-binding transcriptional regulator YafY
VVVAASPSAFEQLGNPMHGGGGTLVDHEAMRDGRIVCQVTFDTFEDAYEDLVRLGAEVEVLEPEDLRARLVSTAGAMLALYES